MYDINFGNIGRSSISSARLAVIAAHMQRERREAGLPVNPLGPSDKEARQYLATKIAEAKRNASGKAETRRNAGERQDTVRAAGYVHSLDFPERD